ARRAERADARLQRCERPRAPAGRTREGTGPPCRVRCALPGEAPVPGEAPGAVDKDAHADSLALDVADSLDVAVLRRHRLRAPEDSAGVRIRRAGRRGGFDRMTAEISHGGTDATLTRLSSAGGGIGRRARLRA